MTYEIRPPDAVQLTEAQARALTDEVKQDTQALWLKLVDLYNGGAHKALGFKSWRAFCAAEFQMGNATAYRLLTAGRVMDELHSGVRSENGHSPIGEWNGNDMVARAMEPTVPKNEAVARELAAADDIPAAWDQVLEQHGPDATAAQVRNVVRPDPDPPQATPLLPAVQRLTSDLELIARFPDGVEPGDIDRVLELWEDVRRGLDALIPGPRSIHERARTQNDPAR
jgi:hypothetical protein